MNNKYFNKSQIVSIVGPAGSGKSRMVDNKEEIINKILEAPNELAGEKFNLDTPIIEV